MGVEPRETSISGAAAPQVRVRDQPLMTPYSLLESSMMYKDQVPLGVSPLNEDSVVLADGEGAGLSKVSEPPPRFAGLKLPAKIWALVRAWVAESSNSMSTSII